MLLRSDPWILLVSVIAVGASESCFLEGFSQPGYSLDGAENTPTPEICQDFCQRTPGCSAFTWTNHTKKCNLKSSWYGTKNARSGKITGPAFCLESDCFMQDTHIVGSNLGYWWTKHTRPTPEQCQDLCQKTKGCNGFTWTERSKICKLKKSFNPDGGSAAKPGRVSGPVHCSTTVGGTCPPPACLTSWVYNGQRQTGCSDPGHHGGLWCPFPNGVNAGGAWNMGSDAYSWCVAPSYCVKDWSFKGENQTFCSSVNSPGRPWCPTEEGIDQAGNYKPKGKFIYCTEDMCVDPETCDPPEDCAHEWKFQNKTENYCSTVDSPGRPWCPANDAVDELKNYKPGARRIWCRRETCSRVPFGTNARDYGK